MKPQWRASTRSISSMMGLLFLGGLLSSSEGLPLVYVATIAVHGNEEAAGRGITIRRVFLDINDVPKIQQDQIKHQKEKGIDVRNLSAAAKKSIPGLKSLPSDLGFVVIEDFKDKKKEAVIHWGTPGDRVGVRVEEELAATGVADSLKEGTLRYVASQQWMLV